MTSADWTLCYRVTPHVPANLPLTRDQNQTQIFQAETKDSPQSCFLVFGFRFGIPQENQKS